LIRGSLTRPGQQHAELRWVWLVIENSIEQAKLKATASPKSFRTTPSCRLLIFMNVRSNSEVACQCEQVAFNWQVWRKIEGKQAVVEGGRSGEGRFRGLSCGGLHWHLL